VQWRFATLAQLVQSAETIHELRAARPQMPQELGDRQMDICEPLLAIADKAADDWPERSRKAVITLCGQSDEDDSVTIKLLIGIRDIFDTTEADRLATHQLLENLVAQETDAPWASWWEHDLQNRNTRGPAQKLARLLKPYGIKAKVIRLSDDSTPRGYMRENFEDDWKRFCPSKTG
jgi:hypothetical protein